MTAFDNTKYDIRLNDTDFRISNYVRNELPSFVPRVASGGNSETEFNVLLSKTLQTFKAGMLQREWKNDDAFFASEFLYPIYDDGVLYKVGSSISTSTSFGSGRPIIVAKAKTKDQVCIVWRSTNGPAAQGIVYIDTTTGVATAMTVPAELSNQSFLISDITPWAGNMWITAANSAGSAGTMYYAQFASTVVTKIAGGSSYFDKLVVHNNQLYGTNAGLSTRNSYLYRYTGDLVTRSNTAVLAQVPSLTASTTARLFIFNNQVTLARHDGIFAYNGVNGFIHLDDQTSAPHARNFCFATIYKGFLHYWMPDGMYRTTGSIAEKLFDISEIGFPKDVTVGKDRMWILYSNSAIDGSSRYDKSLGYDYDNTLTADGRVVAYNGSGMYTYARTSAVTKSATPLLANESENDNLVWWNDKLYIFTYAHPTNEHFILSTDEVTNPSTHDVKIVTSIHDGDFPMVDKSLDSIEIVTDGGTADDLIAIEYRTSGFDGSGGWEILGNIATQSEKKRYVWKELPAGLSYRRAQFMFTGLLSGGTGIAKIILRYTLRPDYRWRWSFDIVLGSDTDVGQLRLADNTFDPQSVRDLRGAIYAARSADTPIPFVDVDRFFIIGTNLFPNPDFETIFHSWLPQNGGVLSLDSTHMKFGSKSLKVVTSGGALRGAQSPEISIDLSTDYVFSTYVYLASGQSIAIEVDEYDAADNFIDVHDSGPLIGNDDWQRIEIPFTSAANVSYMRTFAMLNTATTFYLDGLQLETGVSSTPFNNSSESSPTLTINNTALLKGIEGFLICEAEIMYWYARTENQLWVLRGQLGSEPAAHVNGAAVHPLYRTELTIQREIIDLPETGRDNPDIDYPSRISVELREI